MRHNVTRYNEENNRENTPLTLVGVKYNHRYSTPTMASGVNLPSDPAREQAIVFLVQLPRTAFSNSQTNIWLTVLIK